MQARLDVWDDDESDELLGVLTWSLSSFYFVSAMTEHAGDNLVLAESQPKKRRMPNHALMRSVKLRTSVLNQGSMQALAEEQCKARMLLDDGAQSNSACRLHLRR